MLCFARRRLEVRAEVFIVESLGKHDHREGKIIESILRMGGRHPVYRFVNTMDDLEDAIEEFHASKYRYLHISSHGNDRKFCFSFGALKFRTFADMLCGKLKKRRLFVSACECTNSGFAKLLIPSSGCYSIIGPYETINFDVVAIMWASYYYLAFRNDQKSMKRKQILQRLKRCNKPASGEPELLLTYARRNQVAWLLRRYGRPRTADHKNPRAQEGADQLADYLESQRQTTPSRVAQGYYVIVDGRRLGLHQGDTTISVANGMHFENKELTFNPDHHSTRDDFDPPYRMFARPICEN